MVMYLATAECVPCSLNVINKLKYHQQLFRDVRSGQCLLVQDTSERSGVAELIASFDFPFPALFDADDAILRENPVLSNALAKTFIMDREYNIIWVGSPIQNEKSLELYTKMMYKLCTLD